MDKLYNSISKALYLQNLSHSLNGSKNDFMLQIPMTMAHSQLILDEDHGKLCSQ